MTPFLMLTLCLSLCVQTQLDRWAAELVAKLGNADRSIQAAAMNELTMLGAIALPRLIVGANGPNSEISRRSRTVIDTLRPNACPLISTLNSEPTTAFTSVRFSTDGALIAGCGDAGVYVWETATKQVVRRLTTSGAAAVEFGPGGQTLWIGGNWLGRGGTVVKVDLRTGQTKLLAENCERHVSDIRLVAGGKYIVAAAFDQVVVIDTNDGEKLRAIPCQGRRINQLGLTPDGQRVVVAGDDDLLATIECPAGKKVDEWQLHNIKTGIGDGSFGGCSSGGSQIAAPWVKDGGAGGFLHVRSNDGLHSKTWRAFTGWGRRVAYTPGERLLIAIGEDRRSTLLTVWNPLTGTEISRVQLDPRGGSAFGIDTSPQAGLFAVSLRSGNILVYKLPDPAWSSLRDH
jgi:hypothetical protein